MHTGPNRGEMGKTGTGKKHDWEKFKTFKERGEWVELVFMAAARLHGYHVLKPWGDCLDYDIGIEDRGHLLRVQVKGFSARKGGGYLGRLRHGGSGTRRYNFNDVDLFALYILPALAWYLIPSARVLLPKPKMSLRFYPDGPPRPGRHTGKHDYEPYREAWGLITQSRR
jgi:PD-(D/E)XK endonuclease